MLIIGIAVVLYAFMTLQFLLGMIAVVVIIITILILPFVEQWIKCHFFFYTRIRFLNVSKISKSGSTFKEN